MQQTVVSVIIVKMNGGIYTMTERKPSEKNERQVHKGEIGVVHTAFHTGVEAACTGGFVS